MHTIEPSRGSAARWRGSRIALGAAGVPIPMIGIAIGTTYLHRGEGSSEAAVLVIHMFDIFVFAALFLFSAVVNVVLLLRRIAREPRLLAIDRYGIAQAVTVVAGIAWLICVANMPYRNAAEIALGVVIAAASTTCFVFAVWRDPTEIASMTAPHSVTG